MKPVTIISIFLGYFVFLLVISFLTGKKASNAAFFIGNRKSPWYVVAYGMIGASLSGVTFISVTGWVSGSQFSYMQIVFGYLLGYFIIANVLMPIYYRLNLTSIYTYLDNRFGISAYKTGSAFFLLSRIVGASLRLYLVAFVLQKFVFNKWDIPFELTVFITILFIWIYTFRGGIKTIIWTDTLQTTFMLTAVIATIIIISKLILAECRWNYNDLIQYLSDSSDSKIFFFDDLNDSKHFIKQFLSGVFIAIVMTGLDQDMMQKNISCKNIKEAKRNIYWFSICLVPVNFIFLCLGALLLKYSIEFGIIPESADELFPLIALDLQGIIPVVFIVGFVAAAYSSADSALTSLTTSFTIDILNTKNYTEKRLKKTRIWVHMSISILLAMVIIAYYRLQIQKSLIDSLFYYASYTYGPLLGLYGFGLFTKRTVKLIPIPFICVLSPVICFFVDMSTGQWLGYGILILNGLLTYTGLFVFSRRSGGRKKIKSRNES